MGVGREQAKGVEVDVLKAPKGDAGGPDLDLAEAVGILTAEVPAVLDGIDVEAEVAGQPRSRTS